MTKEIKNCQNCKQDFTIEPEDFEFYSKMKVPPPTFCFDCRLQRRMMFRNERTLYKRPNNSPGKENEKIVSIHRTDTPYTVYDDRTWWGDQWDPMDYGKEYDFSKPFFTQFGELYRKIPLINLSLTNMVNCSFCNVSEGDKGSYMISASNTNEDCFYSNRIVKNKQSLDLYVGTSNELCYELVSCTGNYKVYFSLYTTECADSVFLSNCKNCTDCIGCVNLRNKSNCIFNEQYSKEEYKKKKAELQLDSNIGIEKVRQEFRTLLLSAIHKYANNIKAFHSIGDNLENTQNIINGFDIYDAENCKNVVWGGYGMKDCMDAGPGVGINSELLYECFDTGLNDSQIYWTSVVYHSFDVRYSINCHNCSHIFGCYGLRKKEYCILNKQYTKEEYEVLLPKILSQMNEMPYVDKKERVFKYGEFFPYDISPFAYNETIAQEYFPLGKSEVDEKGWQWYDREERQYDISLKNENIPDSISEVAGSISNEIIECKNKGKEVSGCTTAFKILSTEFDLYKKLNVPLPLFCPNCRHYNRLNQRNPINLWHRQCMCNLENHEHTGECPNEFETSYAPGRPEKVYCEGCYQKEVL